MSEARRYLRGDRVGAMFVDPGTTTGLCWGVFNLTRQQSSYEIVAEGLENSLEIGLDTDLETAEAVAEQYMECRIRWNMELSIPLDHIILVWEDFILYPGKQHSSVRTGLSPVRITAHVQGMLVHHVIQEDFQMASLAQQVTQDQLRNNDLWFVGSEHVRLVRKHAVVWVRRILK